MQLYQIKDEKCPVCGSRIKSETQESQHTNGHWNETRVFECGAIIRWSPNFIDIDRVRCYQCPKSPDEVSKKDKRMDAKNKVLAYIKKLKVDDVFKDSLLDGIQYRNIDY